MNEPAQQAGPPAASGELRAHLIAIGVLGEGSRRGDAHDALVRPETTVGALGAVLARLHAAEVPQWLVGRLSRRTPADLVDAASRAVTDGRVTSGSLAAAYRHVPPERLLEILEEGAATIEVDTEVLTHGAPTLDRLCGEVVAEALDDWQRAALADPHLDLAIAARDLVARLGPAVVPVLADAYAPGRIDPRRLDWYALAVELGGERLAPPP